MNKQQLLHVVFLWKVGHVQFLEQQTEYAACSVITKLILRITQADGR